MKMKREENLQDTLKLFLGGKFIGLNAYIKNKKRTWINYLIMQLQDLEKQEQIKSKLNQQQQIIKIRAETNEIQTHKMILRVNELKNRFFEKMNNIDRPMAQLSKLNREPKLEESEIKRRLLKQTASK